MKLANEFTAGMTVCKTLGLELGFGVDPMPNGAVGWTYFEEMPL